MVIFLMSYFLLLNQQKIAIATAAMNKTSRTFPQIDSLSLCYQRDHCSNNANTNIKTNRSHIQSQVQVKIFLNSGNEPEGITGGK
jgi:hypothetical protein